MTASPEQAWVLPEPSSTAEVAIRGGSVVTLRRHGNPDGPRLVLSHGNGLAIDLYYPFWSLLLDDFDLVVYDLRNHGWNATGELSGHTVPAMVQDFDEITEAIGRHFGKKPQAGVFHSISGLASLLSPAKCAGFEALVLFDPPVCRPGYSYEISEAAAIRNAAMTRRRGNFFQSPQEFAEVLPYLPAFQRVVPGFNDLMARTTLRQHAPDLAEGPPRYQLRCPPEYEAQIIQYASAFGVAVELESIECPIKVIGADPTLPYSFWPTFNFGELMQVDYDFIPEATHLMQMEKPEECAARLREFIDPILVDRG